jgi:hypothetical protein
MQRKWMGISGAIVAAALFVLPGMSHAGNGFVIEYLGPTNSSVANGVTCDPIVGCRYTGTPGREYPATIVDVSGPITVNIDLEVFDGADCAIDLGLACTGDLTFPDAGTWIVRCPNTTFDDLPAGAEYSVVWGYGTCQPTSCINHVVGSDPIDCQMP